MRKFCKIRSRIKKTVLRASAAAGTLKKGNTLCQSTNAGFARENVHRKL
jgi:hypothetical protein